MQLAQGVGARSWLDREMEKSPLFRLSEFSQNRSVGYPHCNPFSDNGRLMVVASADGDTSTLWRLDLDSGDEKKICEFNQNEKMGYYDVARDAAVLVVTTGRALWVYSLKDCSLVLKHSPELGGDYKVDDLPSITSDGREVVVGIVHNGRYGGYHLDVPAEKGRLLFEFDWYANHFHFCPHDKNWVAFSHEGRCDLISDRVWAWHADLAPKGRCVFDQQQAGKGPFFQVGHERWCFHYTSALVVGFGSNPPEGRGIFELFTDARPPRFIAAPAWHVNVSYDGRWAVIDSMGLPGVESGDRTLSEVTVINLKTGDLQFVARSRIGARHPSHPHPVFSPNGRYIFFNESDIDQKLNRIIVAPNPFWTSEVGL